MPPSMHFLTQAAPDPACFAPHIESEIQPLILVESAARAAMTANEKTTTNRAMVRFINSSSEVLCSGYHHAPRGCNPARWVALCGNSISRYRRHGDLF